MEVEAQPTGLKPGHKRPWADPRRWAVLTGFTLLPLFIGHNLEFPTGIVNEWQVLTAMAVGAALGGILLAVAWASASRGRPLLDVLGTRSAWPLGVLWALWAASVGMLNALWAGEALNVILPGPPALWVIVLVAAAAALAVLWRTGRIAAVLVGAALTVGAALIIAPHVAAGGSAYGWRMVDGACFGCGAPTAPFALRWPYYWGVLVNTAAITAATVLMWVPAMGASAEAGRTRPGRWPLAQACMVAALALVLVLMGQLRVAGLLPTNPAAILLPLSGPGPWRDAMIATVGGGALLWMATVWAAGPPSVLLAESAKRWLTALAAAATLAGALALHPVSFQLPQAYRLYPVNVILNILFAHDRAGLRLVGGAYVIAPLVVVLGIGWLVERWPLCGRKGVTPLGSGLTAAVWAVAVLVSTRGAAGFGLFSGGPLFDRVAPGFTNIHNALAPQDWALALSIGTAVVLYLGVAVLWRKAPRPHHVHAPGPQPAFPKR